MKTFILTLFGEKVDWLPQYLSNCAKVAQHSQVEWKIFSDKDYDGTIKMSFDEFLDLYEQKIGRRLVFDPYGPKHWDIRPAYGVIFEDYLKDSEAWGHTDHDCVYGNVDKFTAGDWEIWTNDPYPTICGHFTLYKNTEKINNLFKQYPFWEDMMFTNRSHILERPLSGHLSPMSWTTKRLVDEGKLKIKYDFGCQSNDKEPHQLIYNNGLFSDGREVLVHHFRNTKKWPLAQ